MIKFSCAIIFLAFTVLGAVSLKHKAPAKVLEYHDFVTNKDLWKKELLALTSVDTHP